MVKGCMNWLLLPCLTVLLFSCGGKTDGGASGRSGAGKLFTLLSPGSTGIRFENKLQYSEEFNMYTFRNFYNGGGVGVGDIYNDGVPHLFFCSNHGSKKLYLNKGNFQF